MYDAHARNLSDDAYAYLEFLSNPLIRIWVADYAETLTLLGRAGLNQHTSSSGRRTVPRKAC
jgi:hypothetical protein